MSDQFSYRDYVSDETFANRYAEYQQRYLTNARESDKVLIELIRTIVENNADKQLTLLDIGCSTGNLLFHLKHAVPGLRLMGGDMMASHLDQCCNNPELKGIEFAEMNVLDLGGQEKFDIITVNAVLYLFSQVEFEQALASISRALTSGGWLLAFDFFHPFAQDLAILEKSHSHPEGLMLHFRPFSITKSSLEKNQFTHISFKSFSIPIDLARGSTYSANQDGFEDLNSYTVKTETGERLLFRGALFQPWCHLLAQKSGS